MAHHLPLLKKSEDRFAVNCMNNQRYMVEAASIYPDTYSHINTLSNISNININPLPYTTYSHSYSIPAYNPSFTTFQPHIRGAYSRFPPMEGSHGEEVKRKRLASE
jgi:hypothetical protein